MFTSRVPLEVNNSCIMIDMIVYRYIFIITSFKYHNMGLRFEIHTAHIHGNTPSHVFYLNNAGF